LWRPALLLIRNTAAAAACLGGIEMLGKGSKRQRKIFIFKKFNNHIKIN
jgi:hypothetical protein